MATPPRKKRLQVFVSSTYVDLIPERQAAVEAILTSGHIPAGMELFTAGDQSQMDVIKRWIDESDVYLLILGHRYGSVEPETGKSYTHLEYEYAVEEKKPLFAVVANNSKEFREERVKEHGLDVIEQMNPDKLKKFRDIVMSKMIRPWKDTKDIKLAIHETLNEFERREELVGWVRGSESVSNTVVEQLARLSQENEALKLASQEEKILGLTVTQFLKTLGATEAELLAILAELNEFGRAIATKKDDESRIFNLIGDLLTSGLLERQDGYTKLTLTKDAIRMLNILKHKRLKNLDTI